VVVRTNRKHIADYVLTAILAWYVSVNIKDAFVETACNHTLLEVERLSEQSETLSGEISTAH
jgi:hypothetical protein